MPADWDLPALQQLWSDEEDAAVARDQELMRDCERCRSAGHQAARPADSSRPDSQPHAAQLARSYMQQAQGARPSPPAAAAAAAAAAPCLRAAHTPPPPPATAAAPSPSACAPGCRRCPCKRRGESSFCSTRLSSSEAFSRVAASAV